MVLVSTQAWYPLSLLYHACRVASGQVWGRRFAMIYANTQEQVELFVCAYAFAPPSS